MYGPRYLTDVNTESLPIRDNEFWFPGGKGMESFFVDPKRGESLSNKSQENSEKTRKSREREERGWGLSHKERRVKGEIVQFGEKDRERERDVHVSKTGTCS